VVQFLVYVVGIVPLTLKFQLAGAALMLSLSYAVGFGFHVLYSARLIGDKAWQVFGRLARTAAWVAIIAAAIVLLRRSAVGPGEPWRLVLSLVAGGAVYGLYLWRLECPRLLELWRQQEE
jgi:hypothetical protein